MTIAANLQEMIAQSSWIRKMFEEGNKLIQLHGHENVFDFSLGNPIFDPPAKVSRVLTDLLHEDQKGMHRYMPNAGFVATREYIASQLKEETNLPFEQNDIVMTVGAGGGLNVVLKTLCNPGDEVIVLKPYFVEYGFYAANHGATIKAVDTTPEFQIDHEALEREISEKTRAIIINSPNNPTGVIYPESSLEKLGRLLEEKSNQFGKEIVLISDEPYKRIVFDKIQIPSVFQAYSQSIIVTSYSKDLALAGERIGYAAISPQMRDKNLLREGLVLSLRILGFVNAPALMQRLIPLIGDSMINLAPYQKNRDILYNHLVQVGFNCVKPDGAFYLFPQCPIEDDIAFIQEAQKLNLLLVPGSGFGKPGYFRIAFCFETYMIERSLPLFTKLAQQYNLC